MILKQVKKLLEIPPEGLLIKMKERNNKYRIYLSPPYQHGNEFESLSEVLKSNWLAPGGAHVERFEEKLKTLTNREYCVALNSGTAAIHLALKSLDVKTGDFVICQSFTYVATANPISYLGAYPIFIDSEPDTLNMDPGLLEEAILDLQSKGIAPKAIIYVHIYGYPAKVRELQNISEKYKIPLIEDAAEALGSQVQSENVGQFGKISILSFNGNKVITTAGGGALLTNDPEIEQRVLSLATQAKDKNEDHSHVEVGYNYRMSNLNAALGLAQIEHLDYCIKKKKEIFEKYLDGIKALTLDYIKEDQCFSNRWLSVFLLPGRKEREQIQERLLQEGIESRKPWKPLHTLHIYSNKKSYANGTGIRIFERGICLPSGVGLGEQELEEIINLINNK